jgi:hypothetical protein
MSLKSDVNVNATKFDRKNIDKETLEFNEKLIKIWADGPRWYEVHYHCFLFLAYTHTSLLETDYPPRSAQPNTVNSAGKAKHPYPNPLSLNPASMEQSPHVTATHDLSRIVCSNPQVGRAKGYICTFMAEDGYYKVKHST